MALAEEPLGRGLLRGGANERPLNTQLSMLTEVAEIDTMHRRAGRDARPKGGPYVKHADAHKYCPLGRCGTRPGAYHAGQGQSPDRRSAKITAWRKAKAQANRRYLEEKVYGQSKQTRN